MSGNEDNDQPPDGAVGGEEPAADDDFGEFEGFEGGVERMQAQPAPSPWAMFPDLLRVQTNAAGAEEAGQPSNPRNGNLLDEARGGNQRTLNPPDVSLGTNQAAGGRVTPDNVHDAALAVVNDHLEAADVAQREVRLRARMAQLVEQAAGMRYRNAQLDQQIARRREQNERLDRLLQLNNEAAERMLDVGRAEARSQELQTIHAELAAIRERQESEHRENESMRQNILQSTETLTHRLESLEVSLHQEHSKMERKLSKKIDDHLSAIRTAVESVAQQTAQAVTGNLSQLVCDAVQNSSSSDNHTDNSLLQSIKVELEKHKEQQKRVLEEERQRQLNTVSTALQSALKHLNGAMNGTSNHKGTHSDSSES